MAKYWETSKNVKNFLKIWKTQENFRIFFQNFKKMAETPKLSKLSRISPWNPITKFKQIKSNKKLYDWKINKKVGKTSKNSAKTPKMWERRKL